MKIIYFCQFLNLRLVSAAFYCVESTEMKENSNEYSSLFDDLEYKFCKKFLDKTKITSCFSPIACLTNIHLMCEAKEFKKRISKLGKTLLSDVTKLLDENDKNFRSVNCFYG